MAFDTYLDSDRHLSVPIGTPARMSGAFSPSLSSDTLLQKDGQFQAAVASFFNSSSGNLPRSFARFPLLNAGLVSGDMNPTVMNNMTKSGPNVGTSSLVTDANSAFTGGTHLERSASAKPESYLNLPGSPVSFSSNNLSISSSSVIDGQSVMQQSSNLEQNCGQFCKRQQQQRRCVGTSQPTSLTHQVSLRGIEQEPSTSTPKHKKPRLDLKQDDTQYQQIIQQLLRRQDPMLMQGHNPQLQTLFQQSKLRNTEHQQILQSIQQLQGVGMPQKQQQQQQQQQQQHQQQQTRHFQQQQAMRHVSTVQTFDSGICARRLMQYIYHLRHRPPDNSIGYWRKFVAEYYAPRGRKRWCLSLYDNVGQNALGVFPQAAMDAWRCDICGSKTGRGFEANFEILPRLSKIKFDSGVIDELLFLDLPHETRFPSGLMLLEYEKAVQETICEQIRVVREGQLRIIYSNDLKILSWEFCARRHEEFLPRRFVAPQVNQLVQAAQRYQSTIDERGDDGVSSHDLKENCNIFVTAGRQLARNLELNVVDDLGFSKRYIRCLQISQVVNSMKDLMAFSKNNNIGPIECLKKYHPGETTITKQEEQPESIPCSPTNKKISSKLVSSTSHISSSEQATMALAAYYQKLQRTDPLKQESPSCSFNSVDDQVACSKLIQGGQNAEQHMIQKILEEMMNNSGKNSNNMKESEVYLPGGGRDTSYGAWENVEGLYGNKGFDGRHYGWKRK